MNKRDSEETSKQESGREYSPYNFMSVIGATTAPHLKSRSLDFSIIDAM